jgi:hypothetical protein
MMNCGLSAKARAMQMRWRCPPGKLVGKAVDAGRVEAHPFQQVGHSLLADCGDCGPLGGFLGVPRSRRRRSCEDREQLKGILKDVLQITTQLSEGRAPQGQDIAPIEPNMAP